MPIAPGPRTCFVVASLLLAATQLAACWDNRCGPGERHEGAACIPIPDGGEADAGADASQPADAAPAADAGGDGAPPDGAAPEDGDADESGLGKICTKQEECTGSADFCAIQPGSPEGYCTFKDCAVGGDDCPAPYTCIDLSAFLPGLTACLEV